MDINTRRVSIGFVSTYPPTVCGLASYTASLVDAIARDRGTRFGLGVVALGDGGDRSSSPDVVYRHRTGDAASLRMAIEVLDTFDTVSIQHEFGIFGGEDGAEVLDLVAGLTVPTVVTFHTVLEHPTPHQAFIIEQLADRAARVMVMSATASQRLVAIHGIDPQHIEVIPHGADPRFAGPSLVAGDRPLALTWGLIGPGKGLESAIGAFAGLVDLDPAPRYLIAGATHPQVRRAAGESYRQSLIALVRHHGLEDIVEFDDRYLDRDALAEIVRSADVVVLPYESIEQVTSGVLVEAIAASKPVVATRFPHAVELLSAGAGITVPHDDTPALGEALRTLLTDRAKMTAMGGEAQRLATGWYWPTIGRHFTTMLAAVAHRRRTTQAKAPTAGLRATG